MSCRVSVLLPVHNGAAFLAEAVGSMLNQTFADFEFLIIDDGSTDATPEILRSFSDSRMKVIRFEKQSGLVQALNTGLEQCRGEYIARMDADDISYPQRLERQISFMDSHPEIGVCGSWVRSFGNQNRIFRVPVNHDEIMVSLIRQWTLIHPTVMFRASVLKQHGLRYDPAFTHLEDAELWSRLIFLTRFHNLPEVLLDYRRHPDQTVSRYPEQMRLLKSKLRERFLKRLDAAWDMLPEQESVIRFWMEGKTGEIPGDLAHLWTWFDLLQATNRRRQVYPVLAFERQVEKWRRDLVHEKYLFKSQYHFLDLSQYFQNSVKPWKRISLGANAKFVIKCLLGWKPRTSQSIAFHMQAYHDKIGAANALKRLRRFYPKEPVMLISDGDSDPDYVKLARNLNLIYIDGERLFPLRHGGRMLHRMLEVYLQKTNADYLMRMDTDTRCDRRFRYLPPSPEYLYGHIQNKRECLQGGCVLIPRILAKRLYQSQIFLDKRILDWRTSWGPLMPSWAFEKRAEQGLISFDWILHWACLELEIPTREFEEIHSLWRTGTTNFAKKHAFVHPDKSLYQPHWQWRRGFAFLKRAASQLLCPRGN